MIMVAKVSSTIAYGNKNTRVISMVSLLTHIAYLFYNISVFSLAGALSDLLLLISLIIAIVRVDICSKIKIYNIFYFYVMDND